ncbi:hypothetical protein FQA39_LY01340 [Lamprigera yunnana]|nr:hypothetical protein FQA39_LY01340 [Lamprigera yunnana]
MELEEPVTEDFKIRCSNIPDEFLKKSVARLHFEQFGEVLHIIIKPKSKFCYVHYKNYKSAQNALLNGGHFNGKKFTISIVNEAFRKKTKKSHDPNWEIDLEVQKELAAMSGVGEYPKNYNLRPESMIVDTPTRQTQSKIKKTIKKSWSKESGKTKKKTNEKTEWTTDQLELLNIIKQPAYTDEEKYKVLESRDKLMRLRIKKHTDLTKVSPTIGTCPDMCPEKERLLRVIQHQVALYEQDTNGRGMNPTLAIKQYSRSSADQEVPLPHELRPVSVLELSMGYLVNCIMELIDTEDVNLSEWYHFLWDRTRSIRKDVTQQELCCQGSVALIEQCARFHIHCSARLVAEDPSVFDQKINTENLTKCLQTLKYMYHDLHLKGESCSNEAEFRAYIILLNLNDGNFMWEVQKLKGEIQKSHEVKFALQIYSAIDKNNFIKFFKLVHSTNYLNACILLRYFVQVRSRALSTILKCYSPRMPYTQFSLMELQSLLAFEDVSSTIEFINSFGLNISEDGTQVLLDRKAYHQPDVPITLERAMNVVESKRQKTIGAVVCGGALPIPRFHQYVPHNSFDDNNILIVNDALAEIIRDAQESMEMNEMSSTKNDDQDDFVKPDQSLPFWSLQKQNIFKTKGNSPPPANFLDSQKTTTAEIPKSFTFKQPSMSIFKEPQKLSFGEKSAGSIFGNFNKLPDRNEEKSNIYLGQKSNIFSSPPFMEEFKQNETIAQNFFDDFKSSTDGSNLTVQKPISFGDSKSSSIFSGNIFANALSAIHQRNETLDLSNTTSGNVLLASQESLQTVDSEATRKLKEEEEQKEERKRQYEKMMIEEQKKAKLEKERIEDMKRRELEKKLCIAKQIQERDQEELEKRRIAALIEKERLLSLEIKTSVSKLMDDLLAMVEEIQKKERLKEIETKMKNYKMKLYVQKWQQKCRIKKRKRFAIDQNPIWLPTRTLNEEAQELITQTQRMTLQNMKRYKCGKSYDVVLPEIKTVEKFNLEKYFELIMQSYCKMRVRLSNEIFWKVSICLPSFMEMKVGLQFVENILTTYFNWKDRYGSTSTVEVYKGIRSFGCCIEKKQGILHVDSSTNGLLFISQEPNEQLFERITTSVKNFVSNVKVPAVIIFVNNNTSNINSQQLGRLLEKNKSISTYKVIASKFDYDTLLDSITTALNYLIKNVQKPIPLVLELLQPFVYSNVVVNIWKKIASYAAWNTQYRICLKIPNLVISLYNQAIEKLYEIVSDEQEYPDFPMEFDNFLESKTPELMPCDYRYFPTFWKKESYKLLLKEKFLSLRLPQYQGTWPPNNEANLEKGIYDYCSKVCGNPQSAFYKVMIAILKNFDPNKDFDKIQNTLWIDIVEAIVSEKLNDVDLSLHHTEFNSKSIFTQYFVIYNVISIEKFKLSDWFYLEHPLIKNEIKRINEKSKLYNKISEVKKCHTIDPVHLDELEKVMRCPKQDQVITTNGKIQKLQSYIADLEESMEVHKKINASVQTTIKRVLALDE